MNGIDFNNIANKFWSLTQNSENENTEIKLDLKTFTEKICNDSSIFKQLDIDNDGYVTSREFGTIKNCDINGDGLVTDDEITNTALKQAKWTIRRHTDKWFICDLNRDGIWSNVETKFADKRMADETYSGLDGTLSNQELAEKYNLEENPTELDYEAWINGWIERVKEETKIFFGVELNEKQMILLKKEAVKQLNTWLMKTGDGENAPLYCQLNATAYTRLITDEDTVSCCGGNIDKPPMTEQPIINTNGEVEATSCAPMFSSMDNKISVNTSEEFKNRLAWSMFATKTQEEQAKMTPEEYAKHKQDWQKIRAMKAQDFRELLLPENKEKKEEFESNSYMSVKQIVNYIDIVESVSGQSWDSSDWEVNIEQWEIICQKVNGTYNDAALLEDKTRADIPENRQALLRFLEKKGWLFEQFK